MSRKPPVALPETDDPYVLLDVRPGASADQIRRAYLRRVKLYKPDRHPAEFRRVREAYDRLREQERWFDAWRQASEVVRQAAEAQASREGDEDGAIAGDEELGEAQDGEDGQHADEPDEPDDDADDEELAALEQQVHAALEQGACAEAATLLLAPGTDALAARPELATLVLEVCCAVVWDEPARFQALVDRYGDLVSAQDTEYRDGALLHRRTLSHELVAWREAVAAWPELHRFVVLGASLRAPAEAELGLQLGQRAAAEATAFLQVLAVASVQAPGIMALYVGMAERWSRHYGTLSLPGPPRARPTLAQAADALADAAQHHRWVRWEQLRPLLVSTIVAAVLVLARSPKVELLVIGMVVVLWGWRAFAAAPEARIYARVLRPTAATWLWATQASPEELAAALRSRLPAAGSWGAFLHPGDLGEYPDQLADDLALLAFSVTAPMIPRLRSSVAGPGAGPR